MDNIKQLEDQPPQPTAGADGRTLRQTADAGKATSAAAEESSTANTDGRTVDQTADADKAASVPAAAEESSSTQEQKSPHCTVEEQNSQHPVEKPSKSEEGVKP